MKWMYLLGIYVFGSIMKIAALFIPKAKLWQQGRKNWRDKISNSTLKPGTKKVWIHCASLGEFEQGRPIIEKIKKDHPSTQVVLSFFSPSGYEIRKNYDQADLICYLPLDTPKNSKDFISIIQPDLVIFVKYEFWYFFLRELNKQKIPTLLISAIFRPRQLFFKPFGGFYRRILFFFEAIFVQNKNSQHLLEGIKYPNSHIAGDTRVDRVMNLAEKKKDFPLIEQFKGESKLLILGSSWPADEEIVLPFLKAKLPENWKCIIAPHEIGEEHVQKILSRLEEDAIRYSTFSKDQPIKKTRYLIIDNIGMLSSLYQYGKIAYIGGGFGKGIHNTLEPITYGLPVIFGPKYHKFEEANALIKTGGGFFIKNVQDLEKIFTQLLEKSEHEKASQKAKSYILENQGATNMIFSYLEKKKYLDSF